MKTKVSFIFALVLACLQLTAQTKRIAYKSHGGNEAGFARAIESGSLHDDRPGFGEAPRPLPSLVNLDSVIFLSDTTAVMVTSLRRSDVDTKDKNNKQSDDWKPGRDTVYHHKLFSSGRSVNEMKYRLEQEYYFANPVDSIKFIRIDQDGNQVQIDDKKGEALLLPVENGDGGSSAPSLPALIALVILAAALGGLFSRRFAAMKVS